MKSVRSLMSPESLDPTERLKILTTTYELITPDLFINLKEGSHDISRYFNH